MNQYTIKITEQHQGGKKEVYMFAYWVYKNSKMACSGGIYGSQVNNRMEAERKIIQEVKNRIPNMGESFIIE